MNIFQLLRDWLRDKRKERWVLILDNVDDASFLLEPPAIDMKAQETGQDNHSRLSRYEYLPSFEHGSVLITTRSREAAKKLVDDSDVIDIHPMHEEHAVALLEKKLGQQANSGDLQELAGALELMPLAVTLAAAYIKQRTPRFSVRQYLDEFWMSDESNFCLLDDNAGYLRRDREASNSIILTWQISFEHIHRTRRSAADLLSLMSFFDRQSIPESLLRNWPRKPPDRTIDNSVRQ